ncbi:hypothetical protein ACMFMG_012005 [Clarireedia jacksonii]
MILSRGIWFNLGFRVIGAVSFLMLSIAGTALEALSASRIPILPEIGGPTTLPNPPSTMTIQYIAIGHGLQNYSCVAVNSVPIQIGASATLFDVTALAFSNQDELNIIPPIAVYLPLQEIYFSTLTSRIFPVLGYHYFTGDGTPFFDLNSVGRSFYGKRTDDLKAPAYANKGPADTGAVDWLQLQDKGGSIGIAEVYRVVTAGGAAPSTCTAKGTVTIPYAAEYCFYDS